MNQIMTRRLALQRIGLLVASATVPVGLLGCRPRPTSLTFQEDDDFYKSLLNALNEERPVTVHFDGEVKITKSSRLLKEFICKAKNVDQLWQELRKYDTDAGRNALRLAFAPELLEHENATVEVSDKSGKVIEPNTILLVAVILMILGATTVATAQALKRPVNIKANVNLAPPSVSVEFQPVNNS